MKTYAECELCAYKNRPSYDYPCCACNGHCNMFDCEEAISPAKPYVECDLCVYKDKPLNTYPCYDCDASNSEFEAKRSQPQETHEKHYDEHYQSKCQPIETMQANMSHEELIGFLKGNIIKYVCRLGKKDEPTKEAAKIRRYAEWLEKALKGEQIDPRN